MNTNSLVRMVNDIAAFFASEPDPNEAARAVAGHLKRFWEPRMRTAIVSHYHAGGEGLTPLAKAGVSVLAEQAQQKSTVKEGSAVSSTIK